jgi:hypothetical protein
MARRPVDPKLKAEVISAFKRHPEALSELRPRTVKRYATNEFDLPEMFWWLLAHPAMLADVAQAVQDASPVYDTSA